MKSTLLLMLFLLLPMLSPAQKPNPEYDPALAGKLGAVNAV